MGQKTTRSTIEILAKAAGMSVDEFTRKVLASDTDDSQKQDILGLISDQAAAATKQSENLDHINSEVQEVIKAQVAATRASDTGKVTAKNKQALADGVKAATDKLQSSLDSINDRRENAFDSTFGEQLLVNKDGSVGERAARALDTQSNILDSVVNGTRAAQSVATAPLLSLAGFARHVIGNPFQAGVDEAKKRSGTLRSVFDDVQAVNKTAFDNSLLKNTPLSELQTSYNAEKNLVATQVDAQLAKDLIPASAAAKESQVLQAQLQGLQTSLGISTQKYNNQSTVNQIKRGRAGVLETQGTAANAQLKRDLVSYARLAGSAVEIDDDGLIVASNVSQATRDNQSAILGDNVTLSGNRVGNISKNNTLLDIQVATGNARVSDIPVDKALKGIQLKRGQAAVAGIPIDKQLKEMQLKQGQAGVDRIPHQTKRDTLTLQQLRQGVIRTQQLIDKGVEGSTIDPITGKVDPKKAADKKALDELKRQLQFLTAKNAIAEQKVVAETAGDTATTKKATAKTNASRAVNTAQNIELINKIANQEIIMQRDKVGDLARQYQVYKNNSGVRTASETIAMNNVLLKYQKEQAILEDKEAAAIDLATQDNNRQAKLGQSKVARDYWKDAGVRQTVLDNKIQSTLAETLKYKNYLTLNENPRLATLNADNALASAEMTFQHNAAKMEVMNSKGYKESNFLQQTTAMTLLNKKQAGEMAKLDAELKNRDTITAMTDQQLANKQVEIERRTKQLQDSFTLAQEDLAKKVATELTIKRGQSTIKRIDEDDAEMVKLGDAWKSVRGSAPFPKERVRQNPALRQALQQFATDKTWGDNPLTAVDNFKAITEGDLNPMTQQVILEVANSRNLILTGVPRGKVKGNALTINANMAQLVNPTTPKLFTTSTKGKGELNHMPSYGLLVDPTSPVAATIAPIKDWDKLDPLARGATIKKNFIENYKAANSDRDPSTALIAGHLERTFRGVMGHKTRSGNFAAMGIPAISKLEYKHKFSLLTRVAEVASTVSLEGGEFETFGSHTVNFMDSASWTILINKGEI